jgi:hypothetical protein
MQRIRPEEHDERGGVGPFTVQWSFIANPSWIPAFAGMTEKEECRNDGEEYVVNGLRSLSFFPRWSRTAETRAGVR